MSLHVEKIEKNREGDKINQKGISGDLSPREYFINVSKKYNYGYLFILGS
jgi:hypothetical protein